MAAKLKAATFSLGATVRIGEYELPGAGEYDVSAVHVEAKNLEAGIVYWLRAEDLQVAYLSHTDPTVNKHEEAAATDILVINLSSEDTAASLKPLLKSMEPSFLFLIGAGATPDLMKSLSLPMQEGGSLKITKVGLPEEGTTLIMPA